jgi:hypothetical protein
MPDQRRGALSISIVIATLIAGACGQRREASSTAGFWFEPNACVIPVGATATFPPLNANEVELIQQRAREELELAFSGVRIHLAADRTAFWRVQVMASLPARANAALPKAGESVALGILGGTGAVGFDLVALNAIRYAPDGASRQTIVEGIGRGVGRVAIHEFAHQMLGVADVHDTDDQDSYEYPSPDRPSQYYGYLHWTHAWPLLQKRLGT